MTARARKKPALLVMPPLTCQVVTCAAEYPCIGDYADTDRAALLGGWIYRAGGWLCDAHRDHIPWWPGRSMPALPARVPGATRAEFLGVVPVAALPAGEPDPLAEYQALSNELHYGEEDARLCTCIEGNDEALVTTSVEGCPQHGNGDLDGGDLDPWPPPPLPQRKPGASYDEHVKSCDRTGPRLSPAEMDAMAEIFSDDEPRPGGTIYPQLTPQALAGGAPLESLAAGPEENEATS